MPSCAPSQSGLTHDALIALGSEKGVIEGSMDGKAFEAYISQVLVPQLEPGTVVILDNLATHKNKQAAQALKKAGCWFLFLPHYSTDLNPIEVAFAKAQVPPAKDRSADLRPAL